MQFFLDSADLDAIISSQNDFALEGVTTNPIILARDIPDNTELAVRLARIRRECKGKLFVQVTSCEREGMIRDARTIVSKLGGDISVKIPATPEGFAAMKVLTKDGISVTATAVYSTSQALLASECGADYAAPYISHLDNLSLDGCEIASRMAKILADNASKTKILAASFRTAAQVERCIAGGVGAVTVTADMLKTLASHPGTDIECAAFADKWQARFGEKGIAELL